MQQIFVEKTDGEKELFDPIKLGESLKKAGLDEKAIDEVVEKIQRNFEGKSTNTTEIYEMVFKHLKGISKPVAARYSLKRAVFDLGPSGFPFEYFLAELYKAKGYDTEVGVVLKGHCTTHEVDVVATNNKEVIAIEAKFHNKPGFKTDMKVLLYITARFDDLSKNHFSGRASEGKTGRGLIITNTNFTTSATRYADCAGTNAISWNYPDNNNLHDLIENSGLHPLTCLTTLSNKEKKALLDDGVVLCKLLQEDSSHLKKIGMNSKRINEVLEESDLLCTPR